MTIRLNMMNIIMIGSGKMKMKMFSPIRMMMTENLLPGVGSSLTAGVATEGQSGCAPVVDQCDATLTSRLV